ncbi:MAG: aspartate-semialdehyde dehydrogenase, partial [Planctomycetota bacterium]
MALLNGKVGIVGATGAVGEELIRLFEEEGLRPKELRLMASARSVGKSLKVHGKDHPLLEANHENMKGLDVALFMATSDIAKELALPAAKAGTVCIDNSSAFRMDPGVPLVIPEINPQHLEGHGNIIANPNCSTIILLMPLAPLHRTWKVRRVVVSTYQAASGAGLPAMEELKAQARDVLDGKPAVAKVFKHPLAFNLFSHDSDMADNGFNGEENKVVAESRKILGEPTLDIVPTCVRVPVLRAHTESVVATFEKAPNVEEARRILSKSPGVEV